MVFDSCGGVFGSGFFGVGAGKYLDESEGAAKVEILRSVFNLPPSNELQIQIEGDVSALPYHGNWQGLVMDKPTLAYWFSEDMVSSFFFGCRTSGLVSLHLKNKPLVTLRIQINPLSMLASLSCHQDGYQPMGLFNISIGVLWKLRQPCRRR